MMTTLTFELFKLPETDKELNQLPLSLEPVKIVVQLTISLLTAQTINVTDASDMNTSLSIAPTKPLNMIFAKLAPSQTIYTGHALTTDAINVTN